MIANLFNATTLPVLQEVAGFTQARQNVLTSNIANYGTPGYKVRDLSVENFNKSLQDAITARDVERGQLSPGMSNVTENEALQRVRESLKDVLYHDETNVSLEQQVNEAAKNQLMHSMAISVMTSQFRLLQTAVSERV